MTEIDFERNGDSGIEGQKQENDTTNRNKQINGE